MLVLLALAVENDQLEDCFGVVTMSQKRPQDDAKARCEGASPDDKRRRTPAFFKVVQEAMKLHSFQNWLEPALEPLIRKVVKEEVESALKKHLSSLKRSSGKEINCIESRSFQLQFLNNISLPVFTGARIEGEECSTIKVDLFDCLTGERISSGPLSSAKVEIVVLEGDFDGDEGENWTPEEFKNNIVREREGKKPLLTGDPFLTLKEGVGSITDISFTDNSSWTRSRRFRLGARVVDSFDGTRVKEAKTVSFIVRDHRGELYKKHHPPSLFDEVWRLEKIGKDGAFHKRLTRENITTVKDFLTLLHTDPTRLRNILGTGMSAKMWDVTVEHARTCALDKTIHLYYPGSQKKSGVVFNIVGQVMGLLSEGQYLPVDKLTETQKVEAQSLVMSAFEHRQEVLLLEDEALLMGDSANLANIPHSNVSRTDTSNGDKVLAPQKLGAFDYAPPSASSPDIISSIYSVGAMSGMDDYSFPGIENTGLRYEPTLCYPGQVNNSLICDTESITQAFCDEDHLPFFESDLQPHNLILEPQADLQTAVDGFLLQRTSAVSVDKAQMRWRKLLNVFKWFRVRKEAALRRTRNQRYGNAL